MITHKVHTNLFVFVAEVFGGLIVVVVELGFCVTVVVIGVVVVGLYGVGVLYLIDGGYGVVNLYVIL